MAKRDSYEDDDDFLDEEIADWDDDEEGESADSGDADDDVDDDADDDVEEDDDDDDETPSPKATDEDEDDDRDRGDAASDEDDAAAVAEEPEPVEEEIVYPPDDEKALAALKKLKVRLDVNDKGNVWRAIFDDTNGKDPSLVLLKGLPALKELWLLGTKVTAKAADAFKEEHPKIKVYA